MLVFDRGLGGDGWAGFALLESIAADGDLWLENNHRGVMNGLLETPAGHLVSSHLVSQYPPGIAVLDAVPFAAGRALDRLLPGRLLGGGAELPPAGRVPRGVFLSAAMIVFARNAAALLGLGWIALALLRLGLPERTAAAAVALTFFGGPLIFYALVGMTHAPTFALAALLLLLLVKQREEGSLGLAFAAGVVVGGAVLVRYSAVALLVPAVVGVVERTTGTARTTRTARTARTARTVACLAGFALFVVLLPFWWRACFGSWLPPPYGGRWVVTAASPWNVLFGPVHGFFLFHPAMLFAAVGVLRFSPRAWRGIALAWFLAVAVLHGWWSEAANPGGYGQRFLIDALPALALGCAGWLGVGRARGLRVGLAAAATLAGWVLFFAAVGGLVIPPAPWPWPQRLGEYAVLLRHPPGPVEMGSALRRSSFLLRLALGPR